MDIIKWKFKSSPALPSSIFRASKRNLLPLVIFFITACAYPPYNELSSYNYPLISHMNETGKFETIIEEGVINEDFHLSGVPLPDLPSRQFSLHTTRGELNISLFSVTPELVGSPVSSEPFNDYGNFFDTSYNRLAVYPAEDQSDSACLTVNNTGDTSLIRFKDGSLVEIEGNSFQSWLADNLVIDNSDIVIMSSDLYTGNSRELYMIIFIKPDEIKLIKLDYSYQGIDFSSYNIIREMVESDLPTDIHVRDIYNSEFHYCKNLDRSLISLYQRWGYANYAWNSGETSLESLTTEENNQLLEGRIIEYFEDGSILTLVEENDSIPYWNYYNSDFEWQGSINKGTIEYLYSTENDMKSLFSEVLPQGDNSYMIRNYSINTTAFQSLFQE